MIRIQNDHFFLVESRRTAVRACIHTYIYTLYVCSTLQVGNGSGKVSEQGRGESRDRKGGKKTNAELLFHPSVRHQTAMSTDDTVYSIRSLSIVYSPSRLSIMPIRRRRRQTFSPLSGGEVNGGRGEEWPRQAWAQLID